MKIKGKVATGLGKAAYFLSKDFYAEELKKRCGFKPFAGTLNVIVPEEYLDEINRIKVNCNDIIKPDNDFGAVKFIKATLNDDISGGVIFPDKTTHDENYLEFIAKDKLRDELDLKDNDEVTLEI